MISGATSLEAALILSRCAFPVTVMTRLFGHPRLWPVAASEVMRTLLEPRSAPDIAVSISARRGAEEGRS
jgi:hypothetical protein